MSKIILSTLTHKTDMQYPFSAKYNAILLLLRVKWNE